ncbi:MAG: hypothetical protein GY729_03495 [Desulfobacteraceae bacterium]|nr:hypothetical protein [Desulfobacteraceae bacterium]
MDIQSLKTEKTVKLLNLEAAKAAQKSRDVFHLGSEVAALEGKIAAKYLELGDKRNAVINIISQASCLCDSGRFPEARRHYNVLSHWLIRIALNNGLKMS